LNSPVINSNETAKEITEKINFIAKESIKECQTLYDVSKQIKELVDFQLYGRWDCDICFNIMGSHYTFGDSSFSVTIRFGRLNVRVYRVCDTVWLTLSFNILYVMTRTSDLMLQ
jgi:hypothetical protein